MKRMWWFSLLMVASALSGVEYFVSPTGDDAGDGGRERPFRTVQKGADKLQEGDILTLLPGEYRESVRLILASKGEKKTLIRALIPGTAVLRGDCEAPSFTKVPGTLFTYSAEWDAAVSAVNEIDSFTTYPSAGAISQLDFERGRWYYDGEARRLYVVTSDGRSPAEHHLTLSQIEKHGMMVGEFNAKKPTRNLEIRGLVIRGFFNAGKGEGRPSTARAIQCCYFENCVIADCDLLFNGCGVSMWRPKKCVIDNVRARSNGAIYDTAGGNIIVNGPCYDTVIRNCSAFNSVKAGIRFYGDIIQNCTIEHCMAGFNGYGDFWIKGKSADSLLTECTGFGASYPYAQGNVHNVYYYCGEHAHSKESLQLWQNSLAVENYLADPKNGDFRSMGDCPAKEGLTRRHDVFFLSPDGRDDASGDSIRAPWKTLANVPAGASAYLLPGSYDAPFVLDKPGVTLASRGNGTKRPMLNGGVTVRATGVTLKRLSFGKDVLVEADDVTVRNCGFHGCKVVAKRVRQLSVHNCAFDALPWELEAVQAKLHSNLCAVPGKSDGASVLFCRNNGYLSGEVPAGEAESRLCRVRFNAPAQGDFSVDASREVNGYGFLGMPLGTVYRWNHRPAATMEALTVRAAVRGVADVEFFTAQSDMRCWFSCGLSPKEKKPLAKSWTQPASPFRSFCAEGLEPGKTYYGWVQLGNPKQEYVTGGRETSREMITFDNFTFTVPQPAAEQKEYFVSMSGDDANPGSREKPFRSLSKAASVAGAGDTVTVGGGCYNEGFYVRASGTREKPVTFRAAPGEKVWWEGCRQQLASGAVLMNKRHVRFQGFYMRNFIYNMSGAIATYGGSDIELSSIFYDGRSPNYTPNLLRSFETANLWIHDCAILRGFEGIRLQNCADYRFEHNFFHINQLTGLSMECQKGLKGVISHNIFFDSILQKQIVPAVNCGNPDTITIENNLFYWRIPAEERLLTGALGASDKRYTLPEYRALAGGKETNVVANPRIRATPELFTFKNMEERNRLYQELESKEAAKEQGRLSSTQFQAWDWEDLEPAAEFKQFGPVRNKTITTNGRQAE